MHFDDIPQKQSSGNKKFISLGDGESITGVFAGEPIRYLRHWWESQKRSTDCTRDNTCEGCKQNIKVSERFRINFIKEENKVYVAKIFEQSMKVYTSLSILHKKYDLRKYPVTIHRMGKKNDTVYQIMPELDKELKPHVREYLNNIQLNDLGPIKKQESQSPPPHFEDPPTEAYENEIPF
jgi:hypothetical protein